MKEIRDSISREFDVQVSLFRTPTGEFKLLIDGNSQRAADAEKAIEVHIKKCGMKQPCEFMHVQLLLMVIFGS